MFPYAGWKLVVVDDDSFFAQFLGKTADGADMLYMVNKITGFKTNPWKALDDLAFMIRSCQYQPGTHGFQA